MSKDRAQSAESTGYVIRPNFQKKFRPTIIQGCLHEVLVEQLSDKDYDPKTVHQLTTAVADAVRARMKLQELDRYKFIVQVVIGEQRGEGTKMSARCYWDADTDNFAHDMFINVTIVYFASLLCSACFTTNQIKSCDTEESAILVLRQVFNLNYIP